MANVVYPRLVLRSLGLSLRLCRLVLGLTQQEAGELLGIPVPTAKVTLGGYETGAVRMQADRLRGVISLLERACVYMTDQYGTVQAQRITVGLPNPNDPEYALKLFKYWQTHDGTKAGLRRLIPYLAAKDTPRTRMRPLPPSNGRTYTPDELQLRQR